jgi:hypothetical protein
MPRLTRRERSLAIGVTAAVAAWAFYGSVIAPTTDRIRTLERVIPDKNSELAQIRAGIKEYNALQRQAEQVKNKIASQSAGFHLPTHLETLLDTTGLAEHLVTMTPNDLHVRPDYAEAIVEIRLQGLTLPQIVEFMAAVQTPEPLVRVGSASIKRAPDKPGRLEATLVIHSPLRSHEVASSAPATRP